MEGSCSDHPEAVALRQAAASLQGGRGLHHAGPELRTQVSLQDISLMIHMPVWKQ